MKGFWGFCSWLSIPLFLSAQQDRNISIQQSDFYNGPVVFNEKTAICGPSTPPPTPPLPLLNQFTKPTLATNMASTGVSLAVKANGTVWGSGSDQSGEMGDGTVASPFTTNNFWVHVADPNIVNIKQVSLGFNTAMVLRDDGTVWGWGDNWWGKIGDGNSWVSAQPVPQQTMRSAGTPLVNAVKVACGYAMTFALTADHHVYGWGNNYGGTMGPSYVPNNWYPWAGEITDNGTTAINWAMDIGVGDEFVAILRWDSTLWTMGNGQFGQLGNGNSYGPGGGSNIPSLVVKSAACNPLTQIVSLSAGRRFMLALDATGAVYGWGLNNYGQTGTGAGPDVFIPKRVLGNNCTGYLSGITSISASGDNGYAVDSSGNLWSWGSDFDGQLGDGSPPDGNFDCPKIATSNVLEVQSGLNSVLILKSDGCYYGAGNNWYGSLGGPLPASCCGYINAFMLTNLNGNCLVPLPVEYLSFSGIIKDGVCHLSWSTASELNNSHFVVEKSREGISFEKAGQIKGSGNSSHLVNYSFFDKYPYAGTSYYRLKQVDFNGHSGLSSLIAVQNNNMASACRVTSTGTSGIFALSCNQANGSKIRVINMAGELVLSFSENEHLPDILDLQQYPAGIYMVNLITKDRNYHFRLFR